MEIQVLVIGAGASGLTAALTAARAGCRVLVLEAQARAAKKILATGNGKCNFSNRAMSAAAYRSEKPEIVKKVIAGFSADDAEAYMKGLGIWPADRNGYLYPASGQAASVADCLEAEAVKYGVEIHTNEAVRGIEKQKKGGYRVRTDNGIFDCRYLVIAAGTEAGIHKCEWNTGAVLAQQLGLHSTERVPALTALKGRGKYFKKWTGVRCDGEITLFVDGRRTASDRGELQLTDYGISGIPVFQISRFAAYGLLKKKPVRAIINFMPSMTGEELESELHRRVSRFSDRKSIMQLCGLFNSRLSEVLLTEAGIRTDRRMEKKDVPALVGKVCRFALDIYETNSMEQSQVCAGGISLEQIDPQTMEDRKNPGLYLTGELLDADGICGGYNLHWAWATGLAAGKSIAGKAGANDKNKQHKAAL